MRVSFIHSGGEQMASYRYRSQTPAQLLQASINDVSAEILVFAKPQPWERKYLGKKVCIADFCDDHFSRFPHYLDFLGEADLITCSTEVMQAHIKALGRDATVIPEAYAYEEKTPHCNGSNLLWFGHPTNLHSIHELAGELRGYHLRIVSDGPNCIKWSFDMMPQEFAQADIVILPTTVSYKSANRAVEAIRQGCRVVANPHPALKGFPIWQGDIKEGIEWTISHLRESNLMTLQAQDYVRERFSPKTLASAWRNLLRQASVLAQEKSAGRDGQQLTSPMQTIAATCDNSQSQTTLTIPPALSMSWNTSMLGKPNQC